MIYTTFVLLLAILSVIIRTSPETISSLGPARLCPYAVGSYDLVDTFNHAGFVKFPEKNMARIDDDDESNNETSTWSFEGAILCNLSSEWLDWKSNRTPTYLNMRSTRIFGVSSDTFLPVQHTLMILDLGNATMSVEDLDALMYSLRNDKSDRLSYLTTLSLASMSLTSIPYDALRPVQYSLKALSLFGNNFHTRDPNRQYMREHLSKSDVSGGDVENTTTYLLTEKLQKLTTNQDEDVYGDQIDWGDFPTMPLLVELDLRQCNINHIKESSFDRMENLKRLHMSRNNILILPGYIFRQLKQLVFLDISFNEVLSDDPFFRSGLTLENDTFANLDSLESLYFSNSRLSRRTIIYLKNLPKSLLNLSLCNSGLSSLHSGVFQRLSSLKSLDISFNRKLGTGVSNRMFDGLIALQELRMIITGLSCIKPLNSLSSLKSLNLSRNSIVSLDDNIEKFLRLESLDVSHNFIHSWTNRSIFAENDNLKTVYLHSNSLSVMSEAMLTDFKSLNYLSLASNHFVCNCNLEHFMKHVLSSKNDTNENSTVLLYSSVGDDSHVCIDYTSSTAVKFTNMNDFCASETWRFVFAQTIYVGVGTIVTFLCVGTLIYRKWSYIRNFAILIKNATMISMMNSDDSNDRIFVYDLFVSYSDENRGWIMDELIPNLENEEARLGICLHERDFQVGVSILENITLALDRSRTILLIISGSFLNSQWCVFEMHLAKHRLLETCRDGLILVLLEDVPKKKRPKTLRYLMITTTYIVWPKNSEDGNSKALFWKRLKRAITASRSKQISTV